MALARSACACARARRAALACVARPGVVGASSLARSFSLARAPSSPRARARVRDAGPTSDDSSRGRRRPVSGERGARERVRGVASVALGGCAFARNIIRLIPAAVSRPGVGGPGAIFDAADHFVDHLVRVSSGQNDRERALDSSGRPPYR